jgi:demethylmenaquinone methyltransferase/2-methoxy-6-polyprenyl-1,4-benzoquinol methylase
VVTSDPTKFKQDEDEARTTHFGFRQVPIEEKASMVAAVFDSVAGKYDLINDVMSLGIHRLWRRFAINLSGVGPGQRVLDVAGGTGEFTARLARAVGPQGLVVTAEINQAMLQRGRARWAGQDLGADVRYVQADAEHLPFPDDYFDCATIAFGLRNVTDQGAVLESVHTVVAPGKPAVILEFSHAAVWGLQPLYDLYSFQVMPLVGRLLAGERDGYRYLAESIRVHPDQETLKRMMERVGFVGCEYFNLSGGIVAVHRGHKRHRDAA